MLTHVQSFSNVTDCFEKWEFGHLSPPGGLGLRLIVDGGEFVINVLPGYADLLQMFAYAAKEHCAQHGTRVEHFAKIASKNRTHGSQNPRAAIQVHVR